MHKDGQTVNRLTDKIRVELVDFRVVDGHPFGMIFPMNCDHGLSFFVGADHAHALAEVLGLEVRRELGDPERVVVRGGDRLGSAESVAQRKGSWANDLSSK